MNKYKLRKLFREFPFLEEVLASFKEGDFDVGVNDIKVKKGDKNLLFAIPWRREFSGNLEQSCQGTAYYAVMPEKIIWLCEQSEMVFAEIHEPDRVEPANPIGVQLNQIGKPKVIVEVNHDDNGSYNVSVEIVVYKMKKFWETKEGK